MIRAPKFKQMLRTLALACTLAIAGCSGGEAPKDDPETVGPASPLLYEIANADEEVEGWMLGTIHALPDGTDWRTPTIDQIVEDADRLFVEVAGLDNPAAIGETFTRLATTPELGPLSQRVTPGIREGLEEMIDQSDIAPSQFHNIESWAAAIMLSRVGATGNPGNGVDRFLIEQFKDRPVHGFELAAQQLGIFDELAAKDQRDLLEGTVREWMASRGNPGRLTKAWLAGDEAALVKATTTGIMADPELRDALLVDRNTRWIPTILRGLEDTENVLVAVGAAHIVGPDGLPAMLEAHGYTVRRVH